MNTSTQGIRDSRVGLLFSLGGGGGAGASRAGAGGGRAGGRARAGLDVGGGDGGGGFPPAAAGAASPPFSSSSSSVETDEEDYEDVEVEVGIGSAALPGSQVMSVEEKVARGLREFKVLHEKQRGLQVRELWCVCVCVGGEGVYACVRVCMHACGEGRRSM